MPTHDENALELAIECYIGGEKYFSAIHLAGAAEELFGAWLSPENGISTVALKAEKQLRSETGPTPSDKEVIRYLNFSRNTIKHMDDGNPHICLDEKSEARYWIQHALINFYKTGLPKRPIFWKFENYAS